MCSMCCSTYSYYGPTVVEHRSCEIKFIYICAENPESILLGLDWFGATVALISPAGDTPYIRLGRREIYLNSVGVEEVDAKDERDAFEEGRPGDIVIEDE